MQSSAAVHKAVTGIGASGRHSLRGDSFDFVVACTERSQLHVAGSTHPNFLMWKIGGILLESRDSESRNARKKKAASIETPRLEFKCTDSLLLLGWNQPRRRNGHTAFVVVVELHFVVRLCAGEGLLAFGAEPGFAGRSQQRLFGGVRGFVLEGCQMEPSPP